MKVLGMLLGVGHEHPDHLNSCTRSGRTGVSDGDLGTFVLDGRQVLKCLDVAPAFISIRVIVVCKRWEHYAPSTETDPAYAPRQLIC